MKVYHKSSPTLLKGDGSRTTYDTPSFYLTTDFLLITETFLLITGITYSITAPNCLTNLIDFPSILAGFFHLPPKTRMVAEELAGTASTAS